MLFTCLAGLFISALGLQLHGYCLPIWHRFIDESIPHEVLKGDLYIERTDDWLVDLPFALSQVSHKPAFPVHSDLIGSGQNVLLWWKIPVNHLVMLFRPTTWGFLFSPAIGVSWMWWFLWLGLFSALYGLFKHISQNGFVSFWASVALTFSPVFISSFFYRAEIFIYTALIALAILKILQQERAHWRWSVLLTWAGAAFLVEDVYPPFQISAAYFLVALLLGALFAGSTPGLTKAKSFKIVIPLLVIGVVALIFYKDAREAIALMSQSIYPGRRRNLGGQESLSKIFADTFLIHATLPYESPDWKHLGNFVGAATGILFFPLTALTILVGWLKSESKKNYCVPFFILLFMGWSIVYAVIGFPDVLGKLTLWNRMTPNRISTIIAVADVTLIVWMFKNVPLSTFTPKTKALLLLAWLTFLCVVGLSFFNRWVVELEYVFLYVAIGIIMALSFFLINSQLRQWFFPLLTVVSVILTFKYSTWSMGGTDFIFDNELSQRILKIESTEKTKWSTISVDGPSYRAMVLANLFRMLGVRAIDGYHILPDLKLFRALHPTFQNLDEINQSAALSIVGRNHGPEFEILRPGQIRLYTSPSNPAFRELGVTHFLAVGRNRQLFSDPAHFERLYATADLAIYKRLNPATP